MAASTVHSTPFPRYFIASCEESFGLPDGQGVTTFRAYDAAYEGPFRRPIGPLFGRMSAGEVRAWMTESHPASQEVGEPQREDLRKKSVRRPPRRSWQRADDAAVA